MLLEYVISCYFVFIKGHINYKNHDSFTTTALYKFIYSFIYLRTYFWGLKTSIFERKFT